MAVISSQFLAIIEVLIIIIMLTFIDVKFKSKKKIWTTILVDVIFSVFFSIVLYLCELSIMQVLIVGAVIFIIQLTQILASPEDY